VGDLDRARCELLRGPSARAPLPTTASADDLAARLDQAYPVMVLPAQLQLAQDRAVWLGERLREQVERDGVGDRLHSNR